ncbi:ABC transporter permease [Noviherbaspirillum sedimenti]|uniref:ABC transporter permease n=1 Tax=Noviherbaspirillum sedimenti TaxID=2320865 RepID=A0A3A3GHP1_9BURK|nr:ABC transporter permease [Noviherbaspirillum sedimenti]RJG00420.1 ABC transporter permease [Noviherbaspirillum sedimenti]
MWIESTIALKFLRQGLIQTALILVGIAGGVAVIVFITTLITGLQSNIIDRTLGTQSHIRVEPPDEINRLAAAPAGTLALRLEDKRAQRLRSINNWIQVRDTLDTLAEITAVSPVTAGPAFARRGDVRKAISLVGIDPPRYEKIIHVSKDIIAGQFRVGAGDAVIGKLLATELGMQVGSKLRLESGDGSTAIVTIAGIFELGVRDLDLRYVYVDLKQAQSLLNLAGGVTLIDVTVRDLFAADVAANRITRLTGLKAESWMQTNAQLMNALRSQTISTTMIRFFVALSVAFGIASVLAISVTQRTREIGILRAMGIRRRQMLQVFLVQGALLGLVGSTAGALAGYALVWVFNTFGPGLFYIPLPLGLIPVTMAAATITGVLAAMVPAWRASRLNPVEAIRYV